MTQQRPILEAFVKLGEFFRDFVDSEKEARKSNNPAFLDLKEHITLAGQQNGWFTEENVLRALESWSEQLTEEKLTSWLTSYPLESNRTKTVAIIMAGNIPLVGFHDFLTVLITGNTVLVKLSSNDKALLPFITQYLIDIEPSLSDKIIITEEKLENFDAVIATGSDNTARYFEHYFGKYPNIIRKNRNSVAVLNGKESSEQLEALGEDIFRYYGLGCRSVSKLFVPKGYDFDSFFKSIYKYSPIINQKKYANNYDYNKAVYLMSEFKILDNGFLMLKEDESYTSPIASVFYEEYESLTDLEKRLIEDSNKIQCVVADGLNKNEVRFGQTQDPSLSDYADGIDTVDFLLKT